MSRSSTDSSWGRRRSLFAIPTLSSLNASNSGESSSNSTRTKTLKKNSTHRRAPSLFTDLNHPDVAHDSNGIRTASPVTDPPRKRRPSLNIRSSAKHAPSNSLGKSSLSSSDEFSGDAIGEPLFSTPSSATSLGSDGGMDGLTRVRTVLRHGEVQTSAGVFRKKREYLVLTDTHVIRYKSQAKAAEAFKGVPYPNSRSSGSKHGAMPSVGSYSDLQTLSDSSGDRTGRVPLRQMVAVYRLDDGKPYFAVELCYLDEDSSQSSALTLQFNNPEERDIWLRAIRAASYDARLREQSHISPSNLEIVARIVERDNDYDPSNCAIYKIVQQHTSSKASRSSADDLTKVASIICFLAIGVHKVHVIQIMKGSTGRSSPSIASPNSQVSYGVVNLSSVRLNDSDDSFELTSRQPLQPAKHLHLASAQSYEIAARLHYAEGFLRPECGHRLFKLSAPKEVDRMLAVPAPPSQEHCSFDRTLSAYCIGYGINPSTVRYAINYECEDAPRFELLPPADSRRPDYSALALLAIMRSLRYNESFGGLSFAGIRLDSLNGVHDTYGHEYVCTRTKRGTAVRVAEDEIIRSCLLVQEVQALAACSKKLRRMDFSGCVTPLSADQMDSVDEESTKPRDIGCGLVQALAPLCRYQTTNVDWICLNGIQLTDTDMDYLVSAAVDKSCHFRAIEMNRCGVGDRNLGLILDALRAHENTLESVQIAGNAARIDPSLFDSQLSVFGFIRKLNLSNLARTSGGEPLLTAETLLIWRLQELRLSGISLNAASIDAVATYLAHPQSRTLHELSVDNAYLSGSDVATLLHSLTQDPDRPRDLHLDISHNILTKGLEKVTKAIAEGLAPSHLTMRAIEYREESQFRRMVNALTANKTIRSLDMSQTALPGDATDETCRALSRMLSDNNTLRELDWSGEVSRLASSKFGPGINDALGGLKQNKSLITFRVEKQKLGLQGASTLAEVLKENATLRELHCANNEIPLHGLTDLVNSLINNTTLLYLPTMSDGREAAFRTAEQTMKGMSDPEPPAHPSAMRSATFTATSGVRRGLTSVRKSAARAALYTPSFPALSSANRAGSPPQTSGPSSPVSFHRPRARTNSLTTAPSPLSFTVQDIQTTHRLLSEQWDRQCYRLTKYLERNWNLMNDVPVDLEVEDEKFERPESVGSLGKVLEQVKSDTTPRHEKDVYFDSPQENPFPSNLDLLHAEMVEVEKRPASFKRVMLDSGPQTPDSVDELSGKSRQLRIYNPTEQFDEPRTPTQNYFSS